MIREAHEYLDRALAREHPGPHQIQAAISAIHVDAETSDGTDWEQIAALYASLLTHTDSPVVHLNHGVAVAMATDARTGLRLIDDIDGLDDYVYYHSARSALLDDCGDTDAAVAAYEAALVVATSDHQRRFLRGKLDR